MGSIATREITLQDAPDWLLASAPWAELIHLSGSRDRALDKLGNVDPGIIAFMRRQQINEFRATEQDLLDEAIYLQTTALLEGLKSRALGGEIEFNPSYSPADA